MSLDHIDRRMHGYNVQAGVCFGGPSGHAAKGGPQGYKANTIVPLK